MLCVVTVIFAGTVMGYIASLRLKERQETLEQLYRFINDIKDLLRYSNAPVDRIVSSLLQKQHCDDEIIKAFTQKKTFEDNYKKLIETFFKSKRINAQDMELVSGFGEKIGKTDLEGQLVHCDFFIIKVNEQLRSAKEGYVRYSKLYLTAGVLSGLAAAIFVL